MSLSKKAASLQVWLNARRLTEYVICEERCTMLKRLKRLKILTGAALALILSTSSVNAMNITLSKAIEMALESSRSIEQGEEDRDAARWNLSAVRRNNGPSLRYSAGYNKIGGAYYRPYRNSPNYPDYDTEMSNSINVTVPLYSGGKMEAQRHSAAYALNETDLIIEHTRQDVKYQTADAYYQLLENKDLIKVQEEAVDVLNQHLNNVKIQYEVGTVPKSDLLSTKVQLANIQQDLDRAWGQYNTAMAKLNNIIGLPVGTMLTVNDELKYIRYGKSEEYCQKYALSHRADGIVASYEIKRAAESIKEAKSGTKPTINAVLEGGMAGEHPFDRDHTDRRWQVGLQASWNIFDNGVTSATVKKARSAKRKAYSQAYQQLEAIYEKNIKTAENAIQQAEEQYRIAQVRYKEGVDTNLVVIDAQEKLTDTRNKYYNALYNYNTAIAALEKAMGIPVGIDAEIYSVEESEDGSAIDALAIAAVEEDSIDEHTGRLVHRSGREIADVVMFNEEKETSRAFDK